MEVTAPTWWPRRRGFTLPGTCQSCWGRPKPIGEPPQHDRTGRCRWRHQMIVSFQIFEAHLECSTKCWLRSRAESITGNAYAEWARAQNEAYCEGGLKRLFAMLPESDCAMRPPISKNFKDSVRTRTRSRLSYKLRCSAHASKPYLLSSGLPNTDGAMSSKKRNKPPRTPMDVPPSVFSGTIASAKICHFSDT